MLLDPYCFVDFVENSGEPIVEYRDNWSDGKPKYYFFGDLVIDMDHCIDSLVAELYLQTLHAPHLIPKLMDLDCPCIDLL